MTTNSLAIAPPTPFAPPQSGPGSKPPWTPHEVQILTRFYGSISAPQIAAKLHRSARSVWVKAHKLGLRKSHERLREMGRENVSSRWE